MLFRHCLASVANRSYYVRPVIVRFASTINVFDRNTKRIQRDRSCMMPNYQDCEYVKSEIGYRVADRVFDVKRSFDAILDLGCQRGYVSKHLTKVFLFDQNLHLRSNHLLYSKEKLAFVILGNRQEDSYV